MERREIVYQLSANEMVDGVSAHEVAAILYAFGDLVKKTLDATGSEGDLKVNMKPFSEGARIWQNRSKSANLTRIPSRRR